MLARVRSDAPHLTGARRRGGDACHPPDVAQILRLQRTIGNRATTRLLLRQPTMTEDEALADVAQERARFDAAKRTHQQRLAGYAERAKPHVLKQAGITTDSLVDHQTPKMIQAALAESAHLRPYLRNKFPDSAITAKGKFEIHTREDEFNETVKTAMGDTRRLTKDQRTAAYGKVGGVFDRDSRIVHVRSRTKFGHAVHEAMHRVAHPGFHGFWGEFLNEGVTQYFADCLLREQGLPIVTDHDYKAELACAKKLVALSSFETVAAAYFLMQNDGLHDAVMRHLKMDVNKLLEARKAKKVCALL